MGTDWSDQIEECEAQFGSERNEDIRREIAGHIEHYPVLEVGCGTQEFEKHADGEYVGVDFTPEFDPDHVADAQDLPFEDGEFPTVMTKNVLQHVEDWEAALQECARVASKRVVHCGRTHSHETQIWSETPVLKRRFNEDDFLDTMAGNPTSYDCSTDSRLTIFVGRAA